jgi:hypothetical protein
MIDVGDIVQDPDFASTVVVTRRASVIGDDGVGRVVESTFELIGTVATEGNPMVLEAEYVHSQDNVTIYTKTKLLDAATGFQADNIAWGGSTYLVRKVTNLSHFGFYQAECDMINLTSAP